MGNCCSSSPATSPSTQNDVTSQNPSEEVAAAVAMVVATVENDVPGSDPTLRTTLSWAWSFPRNNTFFSKEECDRATNGFSESNFLGEGGFGPVHKGVLENGRQVAIKQLIQGGRQGEREFQAEVEIISRVHHKNLVTLVGWCIADGDRMLVYEFVPNNTLKFHLHGQREPLNWAKRARIALDSAKGLAYLHEDCHPKIIHRDIKSANILLDHKFEAKIADFGLARIFPDDQTHVDATRLAGSFGYVCPVYASSGEFTDKSDVYSFGVILLELVTGFPSHFKRRGSTKSIGLVQWAFPFLKSRDYDMLVDPRLHKDYNAVQLERILECAAACVRLSPQSRPRMIQVVRVLEGHSSVDSLKEGFAVSSSLDGRSNGPTPGQTPPHSFALDPATVEPGDPKSSMFFSVSSSQDQENTDSRPRVDQSPVVGSKTM